MLETAVEWLKGEDVLATTVRTILVYGITLAVVRLGSKRFLGKASAFDTVVSIMLGSIMSRAITSADDMWPIMLSGALLVAIHWALAALAYRLAWLGPFVKGEKATFVRDGEVDREAMRAAGVTGHDLEQAVRVEGVEDMSQVHRAILERDGSISVIMHRRKPRVVDVSVADGVQTLRIELS